MSDPMTGRWITQDPLAEKYLSVSPYVLCGNNPILRIDPDGQKWVDANGNSVWENGKWTQYATPQIQELGNVLKSTITGQQQFEKLINNPANIQVTINDTDKPHIYGHMNPKGGVIFNKETGKYRINSDAEIVIYKLNAEDRANKSQGLLTHLEAMAVNLGHEIEHTTDENIELNANNASKTERERKPDAISQKLKREYEMQKPIITDEKIF